MSDSERETFTEQEVEVAMQEIEANPEQDGFYRRVGNAGLEFLGRLKFRDRDSGSDTTVHISINEDGERLATVTQIHGDSIEVTEGKIRNGVVREASEFIVEHKKEGVVATLGLAAAVGTLYAARKRRH